MTFFGYMMPKFIERKLVGRVLVGERSVESFIEEFFVQIAAPIPQTRSHAFSKTLGLNHQLMAGRMLPLEFDPETSYERTIRDFVTEALANKEPIIVFTRRGSPIHSLLSNYGAIRFFCLSQRVSIPRKSSENEMLLPSRDFSFILDVFNKMLKTQPKSVINILFDNLSDLIVSIGFQKTYHFTRRAVEILHSPKMTALFLVNKFAHSKVTSSLRGLFSNQISFGRSGIQAVKLEKRARQGRNTEIIFQR